VDVAWWDGWDSFCWGEMGLVKANGYKNKGVARSSTGNTLTFKNLIPLIKQALQWVY
jgi:hypothetical protein